MVAVAYQRASERFEFEAAVIIEDFRTGFDYNGEIYNYSAAGVYLESDYAPHPGRKLHLKVDGAPAIFNAQHYLAEVRWRCSLPDNTGGHLYGCGLRFC